jgi:hypothetical protein
MISNRVITMHNRIFSVAIALAAAAAAQPIPQRAAIVGGGNPNAGQCTATVVVDGQAEIEFRRANATMRDLGGAPPQWRRFECTSAMPPDPANFRFAGLNGRGQQRLVTEPRNGGPAVVRIEDSEGGASEYTFRLTWSNYPGGQDRGPAARDDRGYQGDRDRPGDRRFDTNNRGDDRRAMLFQRTREDLDRATSGLNFDRRESQRLDRAQYQLNDLQTKMSQRIYDERELNEVIGSLQVFVESTQVAPRDRNILAEDRKRLVEFSVHHDGFSAR